MSTGDRHRHRLGVEPLETRFLPTTLIPVETGPTIGIRPAGVSTVLVSQTPSVTASPDAIDVTPRGNTSNSTPSSAVDIDGDDATEYAVPVNLANAVPPEMRATAAKAAVPPSEAHESSGKTANERREYREDERAAESSRSRSPALPVTASALPAAHDVPGHHERRVPSPPPPADGAHDPSGPLREYAPSYAANPASPPDWEDAAPKQSAAEGGGLRADPPVPATPPPAPAAPDPAPDETGAEVSPEVALAELLSLDPAELEQTAREFLVHLADLAPGWCNEGRSWEYVWVAAGVLLAGGLAHAAMVTRARARMRLVEFEVENGNECPRYR